MNKKTKEIYKHIKANLNVKEYHELALKLKQDWLKQLQEDIDRELNK